MGPRSNAALAPLNYAGLTIAEPGLHPLDYHIEDFLHAKACKAANTRDFYKMILTMYREHVGLHWPPTDSSVNSFLASAKERGCSNGTVHAYYRATRTWCLWLFKRGKIETNPFDLVEEPPHSRPLPRAPRAADLKKLFAVLEAGATLGKWNHVRDLALFGLLYDTGIRAGEATHLEVSDLNTQLCVATIRGTKTGEDRVVVFEAQTAAELRGWLKAREAMNIPTSTIFISSHRHEPLTVSGLRTNLRRWCRRASIPIIKPHALRHAYAIHTLRNGGDLLDVQRQLGHHNLATTQRYTLVTAAGRKQRHAQHSPRKNLAATAAGEDEV